MKTIITNDVYDYALKYGVHEHPVLTALRAETASLPNAIMQIPQEQGQFMGVLAKALKAQKYLEVGVFTGYSSLVMAMHMGPQAQIFALDNHEEYTNIAKKYWKTARVEKQITLILDNATTSLTNLCNSEHKNTFDIAFIDANKNEYQKYYEYCYDLIKPGGIILIDNTLFYGEVAKDKPTKNFVRAIHDFNQFIYNDARVVISLLPIADGLTIAYKK